MVVGPHAYLYIILPHSDFVLVLSEAGQVKDGDELNKWLTLVICGTLRWKYASTTEFFNSGFLLLHGSKSLLPASCIRKATADIIENFI